MKLSRILTMCIVLSAGSTSFAQTFWYPSSTGTSTAGRVGIGPLLSSPNANLQIGSGTDQGSLNLGGYAFVGALRSSGDLFIGMNTNMLYTDANENNKSRVYLSNSYGFSGMQFGYSGEISFFNKNGSVTAGDQANTTANLRMKIRTDGNISVYNGLSIGGEYPGGCNCKLAVEGKIAAREVQVLATGWPDFVFEKNYHLPTLESVESFIIQNHHLPDVPEAKEAEANGVKLGEMNAILLKKVEELTLYLIESKKENEEFRKRIEALERSK
jgi:hypothetical protein